MTRPSLPDLTPARAVWYAFALAVVAYANAVGNGFALDDNLIIAVNPVVTQGRWAEALLGPYWFGARDGAGLYRPVTLGSFALEWRLWGGSPVGYHLVNILVHALATAAVARLALRFAPPAAAFAAAALFAVHPVHVEAVANVVGRSELYVTLATVVACLVYLSPRLAEPRLRGLRTGLLALLYLAALGSKESGVTLPLALLVVDLLRRARDGSRLRDVLHEAPLFVSLAGVLAGYLMVRISVLGAVTGGGAAPELLGVSDGARLLTALTLWPEYLRLLLVPFTLSADYAPAVLLVSRTVNPAVVAGAFILVGLAVMVAVSARRAPLVGAGIAWFAATVLPVSNLLFPAGILLGERTLYLPSVGGALVVAGAWVAAERWAVAAERWAVASAGGSPSGQARRPAPRWLRPALPLAAGAVALAFLIRTVDRNPTWFSTYTVMNTLAREHPESALALRTRALGLERVGQRQEAARMWRTVLALQPSHYGFLVEAARFFGRLGERATAADLLTRAQGIRPQDPSAYQALAEQYLRQGDGRSAHREALKGLARAGADGDLWALVSEAYIAKGDLEASLRAREAAVAADPAEARNWQRMADVLEALERTGEAREARERARRAEDQADTSAGGVS